MRPPELPGGKPVLEVAIVPEKFAASMRPPELPGGKPFSLHMNIYGATSASMRPPELPGGKAAAGRPLGPGAGRFNEAAGITRRKASEACWSRTR